MELPMHRYYLLLLFGCLSCGADEQAVQIAPPAEHKAQPEEPPAAKESAAPEREAPAISPSPAGWKPVEMAMGWPLDPTCMERCKEMGIDNQETIDGAKIRASSSLKEGNRVYGPELAFDGDMRTAWCEGVSGSGEGEWIEIPLIFSEFSHVQIWPGYLKSDAHWENNGSPKHYRVSHKDWAFEVLDTTVRLDPKRWPDHGFAGDTTDFTSSSGHVVQPIGVGHDSFPLKGSDAVGDVVRIQILEARKGKKYDDTCISEIRLTAIMPHAG